MRGTCDLPATDNAADDAAATTGTTDAADAPNKPFSGGRDAHDGRDGQDGRGPPHQTTDAAFELVSVTEVVIRQEAGVPVMGRLYTYRRGIRRPKLTVTTHDGAWLPTPSLTLTLAPNPRSMPTLTQGKGFNAE